MIESTDQIMKTTPAFPLFLSLLLGILGCSAPPESTTSDTNGSTTASSPTPASFKTVVAAPSDQSRSINITGRVQPIEKLPVVAEVQGIALPTSKLLIEGVTYRKGETMILIKDTDYRLNLQAQKSQFQTLLVRNMSKIKLDYPKAYDSWLAYLKAFDPEALLPELPETENEKLRFFLSANDIYSTYYNIKSAEELLPKYRIRAPFTGVITQGSLSPGSVINPGVQLALLSRSDVYELKASVSSADIARLKKGQKIKVTHNNTGESWNGMVHRIGGTIDPGTQAVPVFIRVSGRNLREGMFLEGNLQADSYKQVIVLPLSAMNRNNQIHIIQDSIVVLKDVQPVHFAQDMVWIRGLSGGEEIIVEPAQEPIVGVRAIPKS